MRVLKYLHRLLVLKFVKYCEAMINYDILWKHIESHFALGANSIHGPKHWRRVEKFGLSLAERNGADITVVRLFAVLHDAERLDEDADHGHGQRGAANAQQLRDHWFSINDAQFKLLYDAIAYHADGYTSNNLTIGTCWDADRLDLGRVGITPSPEYLSTPEAEKLIIPAKTYRLDINEWT